MPAITNGSPPVLVNDDVAIPKRGDACVLQRRRDVSAIIPNVVIADDGNRAVARAQSCERRNAASDFLIFSRRALKRMMMPVHIITEQHNQSGPQRIHALNDAPHPRRIDVRPADMRSPSTRNRQRRAVPLLAHHLDAAHHQHLRLDEPRVDVHPIRHLEHGHGGKQHPPRARLKRAPASEQPDASEHDQRQPDQRANRGGSICG